MLLKDPKKRYCAKKVLNHRWVVENSKKGIGIETEQFISKKQVNEIIKRLKFKAYKPFKKVALFYMIDAFIEVKEINNLRRGFEALDRNCDGIIDPKELEDALDPDDQYLTEESKETLTRIMEQLQSKNQELNYQEWILMTIDEKKFLTESNLDNMFRNFDYDNR